MGTTGSAASPAALLVIVSVVLQEGGAALAVLLFNAVGPVGAVLLRFAGAGLILAMLARPRVRDLAVAQWKVVIALAAALTMMNCCF